MECRISAEHIFSNVKKRNGHILFKSASSLLSESNVAIFSQPLLDTQSFASLPIWHHAINNLYEINNRKLSAAAEISKESHHGLAALPWHSHLSSHLHIFLASNSTLCMLSKSFFFFFFQKLPKINYFRPKFLGDI